MGAEKIGDLRTLNYKVNNIATDNDSTTIARIRPIHGDMNKVSDKNHPKKTVINAMIELSKNRRELKNNKTVNYIVRMIMCSILQNQMDVTGIRKSLDEIVPHI